MTATALATALPEDDDADDVSAIFLPSPPAPRRRNRPAQPLPPGPREPTGADLGTDDAPSTARLMTVLELSMAGHSQEEIGRRYGKTGRTIRNWLKVAKERRIKTLTNHSAESIAAEHHGLLSRQYADLLRMKHRAELRGDDLLLLKIQGQITANLTARGTFIDRMGLLDRLRFNNAPSNPKEAAEASQVSFLNMAANLVLAGDVEGIDRYNDSLDDGPTEPIEDVF